MLLLYFYYFVSNDFVLYFNAFEFQVHREDLCYVWLKSAQFRNYNVFSPNS